MKLRILSLALMMIALWSCSSDDETISDINQSDYFPLSMGNEWNYTNTYQSQDEETTSEETLTTMSESNNAYSFSSSVNEVDRGIITGVLANGTLSKQNGQLIYNGQYVVDLSFYQLEELSIPINNLVIYDLNASAGDNLSTISNSIEQTFNVQGQDIPLTITYSLSTEQNEILETYNIGDTAYNNVLKSNVFLNLAAEATLAIVSVPVLEEQEVLVSSNYYAENIGLIYSDNQISYNFEDLSQFGIPNVDPINSNLTQTIDSYTIE